MRVGGETKGRSFRYKAMGGEGGKKETVSWLRLRQLLWWCWRKHRRGDRKVRSYKLQERN